MSTKCPSTIYSSNPAPSALPFAEHAKTCAFISMMCFTKASAFSTISCALSWKGRAFSLSLQLSNNPKVASARSSELALFLTNPRLICMKAFRTSFEIFIARSAVRTRYIIPIIFCRGVSFPPAILVPPYFNYYNYYVELMLDGQSPLHLTY